MKSSSYWKERFVLLEQSQNRKGKECYAEIEKQYRRAEKELEKQISVWYCRFADGNDISLHKAEQLLSVRELEEFKWDVEEYIRRAEENELNGKWVKQLENASCRYHIKRLEALKLHMQQAVEVLYSDQQKHIDMTMKNVYVEGYYHTAYEMQKGWGIGWDFATPDDRVIEKVINKPWAADGRNFSERIWGNRQKLVNELNQTLTQNIILGQDPQKAIDAIAKRLNVSKVNAGRLVMTEEAFFHSAAQKDCYEELGVHEYQISATLDMDTSEICRNMDGRHFKMTEWQVGVTAPPFHVNCRTATVPYTGEEFADIGERAARDEEGEIYYVPANMTYREWEKAFVEGDKTGLQEIKSMEKTDEMGNTTRTKEEIKKVANNVKAEITNYSSNSSKWSGIIHTKRSLIDGDAIGVKEWSCDISIMDVADDGVIWHEMLHSCSVSYYDPSVYAAHEYIEEATVEFLKQQICKEKNISTVTAYEDKVNVLQTLNNAFDYGTDLEFAKELFNIPLPDRYQWLEDKVDESLRVANASFKDYNDVMHFLENLKGGKYGTIK